MPHLVYTANSSDKSTPPHFYFVLRRNKSICLYLPVMLDVIGSMNWMAPEVLERPYDERSDVWSVGCITLEMATCATCDTTEMAGKLFEIKHSQQSLEEMLEEIIKVSGTLGCTPASLISYWRSVCGGGGGGASCWDQLTR